jgi:hypothetical protein
MAQEIPETAYEPEVEEEARRKRERRVVQEGTALWRRRKEELQRQKHREQREVCVTNGDVPVRPQFLRHSPRGDRPLTSLSSLLLLPIRIRDDPAEGRGGGKKGDVYTLFSNVSQ